MTIDTHIYKKNKKEYASIKITVRGESISHDVEIFKHKGFFVPKGFETVEMKKLFGPVYNDVLKSLKKFK